MMCARPQEVCLLRLGPHPSRSEVREQDLSSALSGCTSSNERGPPAEFVRRWDCSLSPLSPQMSGARQQALVPVPSVVTVTPQRSEVRQRAVLLSLYPLGIRVSYNTAYPVSAVMSRRCFPSPPCSLVVSVASFFVLAYTGMPPRLLLRVTLGDYHRRRSWSS